MKDFIKSGKFRILVVILVFLLGVAIYTATTEGGKSAISSGIGFVVNPIQKISTNISNKVSKTLDKYANADKYYKENEELKQQLNEMYTQMVDYQNIKDENEQYKEVVGLKEQFPDYKLSAPCKVIGRVQNDIYASFFIDKGTYDGIKVRDPVIVSDKLVGFVSDVEAKYSTVTTVLSPENTIGLYCVNSKDIGQLEGEYSFAEKGLTKMVQINRNSKIKKGDIIVSAGITGLVPKDRVIGTVEDISMDKSGYSLTATIKPAVDIIDITNVFVITAFEGQGIKYAE